MLEGKTILVEAEDAGLYWLRRNLITCMYLFSSCSKCWKCLKWHEICAIDVIIG